jgi:hypothetical protein
MSGRPVTVTPSSSIVSQSLSMPSHTSGMPGRVSRRWSAQSSPQ